MYKYLKIKLRTRRFIKVMEVHARIVVCCWHSTDPNVPQENVKHSTLVN